MKKPIYWKLLKDKYTFVILVISFLLQFLAKYPVTGSYTVLVPHKIPEGALL
jgi:hypothetical protein